MLRFTLAWLFAVAVYLAAALVCLVYGVLFDEPSFQLLVLAWFAALIFTWAVVEPAEIVGLSVFQRIFKGSDRLDRCRNWCKDLGIYG